MRLTSQTPQPNKKMPNWLKNWHRLASPAFFYPLANRIIPLSLFITIVLATIGLVWGILFAPTDYQQSDAFRIIYIHVPAAWMSMFIYFSLAMSALVALVWRIRMAEVALIASLPIGAVFTVIALATGSIWGKPMWGTWWVWDARLTAELILLFLYLGIYGLYHAFDSPKQGAKAASILALIGVINLPIIHFSVEWWNTLHQGSTLTKFDAPSMHPDMLWPLLVCAVAAQFAFLTALLLKMQSLLLQQDAHAGWVKNLLKKSKE